MATATAPARSAACSCAASICIVAEGRRRLPGLRRREPSPTRAYRRRIITAPFSPLGPRHSRQLRKNATCVALPTNQPIHPHAQPGRADARGQPGAAVPSDLQLRVHHRREEGLILVDVEHAGGRRAAQQLPDAGTDLESRRRARRARGTSPSPARTLYIATDAGWSWSIMDDPLPQAGAGDGAAQGRTRHGAAVPLPVRHRRRGPARSSTSPIRAQPRLVEGARRAARRTPTGSSWRAPMLTSRPAPRAWRSSTSSARRPGVLHERSPRTARITDARDVIVGTTNASLFAYVADGEERPQGAAADLAGHPAEVLRLQPRAQARADRELQTKRPGAALSKGLERDRAVDETGHQMAVFGRLGSRPFNREEMQRLYLDAAGKPWFVTDEVNARRTARQ